MLYEGRKMHLNVANLSALSTIAACPGGGFSVAHVMT